jgi:hypothetical protein
MSATTRDVDDVVKTLVDPGTISIVPPKVEPNGGPPSAAAAASIASSVIMFLAPLRTDIGGVQSTKRAMSPSICASETFCPPRM